MYNLFKVIIFYSAIANIESSYVLVFIVHLFIVTITLLLVYQYNLIIETQPFSLPNDIVQSVGNTRYGTKALN